MSAIPSRTQVLLLASILVAGCREDLVAGRVNPREVPGPMTLQVVVRDDRAFVGTGAPIEGAEVWLDDAAGRWRGTTAHDGSLVLDGVPTDGSASLTVWAEGYPALTILDLGADGLEVPSRLDIGLGTLAFCFVCSEVYDEVTGEIHGRIDPTGTSAVAVSLPGGWSVSTGQSYRAPLSPALELSQRSQRMVGLELDETEDGARILSFREQVWEGGLAGPPLELGPGDTGSAVVEIQDELDPEGALGGSEVDLAIVDEVSGGIPSALLGLSRRPNVPGSTLVEYALLEGDGEVAAFADAFHLDPLTGAHARGAPGGERLVLREPPHVVVAARQSLDLANAPVELTGGDWGSASARFLMLGTEGQILWVVLPPPGATSVRLPPVPPSAVWPVPVRVAAVAVRWSSEPWRQYRVVGTGWARSQVRELAFDASAWGQLRPEEPPPLPPDVEDCGGTDDLDVLVVDDLPNFAEGVPQSGIEVVVDCAVGRMRATTDGQGRAAFSGLDFANDPPDVSALDRVRRPRTRVALGSDRPVPSPWVINLYRAWSTPDPPPIPVTIERSAAGTELYCWSTGSHPYPRDWVSHLEDDDSFIEARATFPAVVYAELSPARVGCLEFDGTADGSRTMVAFAETLVDYDQESASLVMDGAVRWERGSIRIDQSAATWSAERVLRAFVEDEGPGNLGLPIGMNEGSEIGADGIDTIGLAWVPAARQGTARLRLEMHDPVDVGLHGYVGWLIDVPLDDIDTTWAAKDPPRIAAEGQGADRVLRITGAEAWAEDYYVEYGGRYEYYVPAGHPTVRIGRTPDDLSPYRDVAFVRAFRYDAPLPEQDHWDGEWLSLHQRESAWYPNVALGE